MIACSQSICPIGSQCVECNQTHFYCNNSCAFNNGGCEETCIEVPNESCDAKNQCCSRSSVTCSSKFKISTKVIILSFNCMVRFSNHKADYNYA